MKVFFPPWEELKGGLEFARPALCNYALHVKPLCRFATSPPRGGENTRPLSRITINFRFFSPHWGEWPKAEGGY